MMEAEAAIDEAAIHDANKQVERPVGLRSSSPRISAPIGYALPSPHPHGRHVSPARRAAEQSGPGIFAGAALIAIEK